MAAKAFWNEEQACGSFKNKTANKINSKTNHPLKLIIH